MRRITAGLTLAIGALLATGAATAHDRPSRTTAILPHAQTADEGQAPYLESDKLFLWRMHWINQMEIQSGEIAKSHGHASGVAGFGTVLVQDHRQLENKVARIADRKRIELQLTSDEYRRVREPLARQMTMTMDLAHEKGADFDRKFLNHMADGHLAAIDLLRTYRGTTNDDDIRALIDETLPLLQEHHRIAEALLSANRSDRQNVRGTDPVEKKSDKKVKKDGSASTKAREKKAWDKPEDGVDKQEEIEQDIEEFEPETDVVDRIDRF